MAVDSILKKEVLPPREAPMRSCNVADVIEEDKRSRASVTRSIWTAFMILGLASVLMRCAEIWSW